jgi:hypothetical protein
MIIEGVPPYRGQHCETTTLGVLLGHIGVELSEPMMFGLGEGLGFVYWDAKYLDFPFLGGRSKPGCIARNLVDRLGLTLCTEETRSARKAWQNVAAHIDAGWPVGLQLDSYHLDYFSTKVHFGGHFVAMYGYDNTYAYLVDTAQQGGTVPTTLQSLAAARGARGPMTAKNLSFTVTRSGEPAAVRDVLGTAIRNTAYAFLNPPIANLGYRGIQKAAVQVAGWLSRSSDPAYDLTLAASLMESGGTGGALFRNMYRDFLAECLTMVDDDNLRAGHRMYHEAAALWTHVSKRFAAAGQTADPAHLAEASAILHELADTERAAMQTLAGVKT